MKSTAVYHPFQAEPLLSVLTIEMINDKIVTGSYIQRHRKPLFKIGINGALTMGILSLFLHS